LQLRVGSSFLSFGESALAQLARGGRRGILGDQARQQIEHRGDEGRPTGTMMKDWLINLFGYICAILILIRVVSAPVTVYQGVKPH
jgi:hypothetical protein